MKVELLRLNTTIKSSLLYESVAEIWIIIHLARENLTRRHTHGHKDPMCGQSLWWLSKSWAGSYLTLVHVIHAMSRQAPVSGPYTILMYTLEVWQRTSNSTTIKPTKFAGPHKSHMRQYIIDACPTGPNRCGPYLTQAGATTFGAPNMKTIDSLPFPSDILHFALVAPSCLMFMPLDFYHYPLLLSIAILSWYLLS
jgi:hypothetical protein